MGELRHDGKAVRVDGAPNMFNLQLFYSQAVDALIAATSDRGKLLAARKRLGRQDWERYGIAAPSSARLLSSTTAPTCSCTATGWMRGSS